MGRPRTGEKLRSEKIMFAIEPQMLKDFKALAALDDTTMTEKILSYMSTEIKNRQPEIQAFRNIQAGNI